MPQESEYESSRIERTKRDLYGTEDKFKKEHRAELSPSPIDVGTDWGDTKIISEREEAPKKSSVHILKWIVIFAVVTALGSVGYLFYQLVDPFSKPSDKNIQITFDVPVGVTPGTPVDVTVHVSNQNRVALEYANLTIIYPSGTRGGDNSDKDLRDDKKVLGTIAPNTVVEFHTKAIFLGEENSDKEIRASLEYRFVNINSVFTKDEVRPVHLLSAPINLTVDTLKEINAGQQVELAINAISNTVIPLRDVLVKVEYPVGFTFADAEPKPTFGNNIWRVGSMDPTGKFALKVRGVLAGEDTQEKVFHTSVGVGSDLTEREITTSYATVLSAITLQRPFIGVTLLMGHKPADQAIAHFGQNILGEINWHNNLSTKIINAQIEVRLKGVALDRTSVTAGSAGFYRSLDDTILWDERGDPSLAVLEAGSSGSENFNFFPLPSVTSNQLLTNPTIIAEVTVRGKRISESGVPEEIKTVITENVKISSQAQFAARSVYYAGPFINTGPLPPRVEQETSYTIIWSLVNTSNTLQGMEVRGTLPAYVRWAGSVSPGTENIIYNSSTNEVIWSPGDIPAGTGVGKPPREVAFQIVLTPSLSQLRKVPVLMNNIHYTATDSFTGEGLSGTKNDLSTLIATDRNAPTNAAIVLQ